MGVTNERFIEGHFEKVNGETEYVFAIDFDAATMLSLNTEVVDLTTFGQRKVWRASNIEFDCEAQLWVCTFPTGERIPDQGKGFIKRSQALAWERDWANDQVQSGSAK